MRRIVLSSLAALSLGLTLIITASGTSRATEAQTNADVLFRQGLHSMSGWGSSCSAALADLWNNTDEYLVYLNQQCLEVNGVPGYEGPLPHTEGNMPYCTNWPTNPDGTKWQAGYRLGTGYAFVCYYPQAEVSEN
jgi:hypothetical protein